MNLAIFLSGTGSNFLAIARAIESGKLAANIRLVASNCATAPGLHKARELKIKTIVFNRLDFESGKDFADYMLTELRAAQIDLIALSGYLRKIPPRVVRAFDHRVVNIHPALLPKYGGKGMYGLNVHRAVIEAGETQTGVTIHFINDQYDEGEIIAQSLVPVLPDDTPEVLAQRVLKVEHQFYAQVLNDLARKF